MKATIVIGYLMRVGKTRRFRDAHNALSPLISLPRLHLLDHTSS
jgi:hypothetical protein